MGFIQIMIGTAEGNFGGFLIPFFKQFAINFTKKTETIVKIDASILKFEIIYAIIILDKYKFY